ncbi:AAA family ATPase [Clostridiaceae bacterium M8S5]|nr:AAA family ATPase [Clostridiaceae bacterium M8S5]
MREYIILLLSTDIDYNEELVKYINDNLDGMFYAVAINNVKDLCSYYYNNTNIVRLLLIQEQLFEEDIKKLNVDKFLITENCLNYETSLQTIYKYQRMDQFINKLHEYCEKNKTSQYKNDKAKINVVYSPVGGVGKTFLSLACSIVLGKSSRVLYINLEDITSINILLTNNNDRKLSELLYYIKNKKDGLNIKIDDFINTSEENNIDYLVPIDSINDMNDLTPDDMIYILESLFYSKLYDYIFIDLQNKLTNVNLQILNMADNILLPFMQDVVSLIKAKNFIKQVGMISQISNIDILKKVQLIINKYNDKIHTPIEFINVHPHKRNIRIPYCENLFNYMDGKYHINIEAVRDDIKKILENI